MTLLRNAAFLIALTGLAATSHGQASVQFVPMPAGATAPEALAISPDGSTIAGTATFNGSTTAWYWRGEAVATLIPQSSAIDPTYGIGVSGNGGIITWSPNNFAQRSRKFLTASNSYSEFPVVVAMQYPHMTCISADGLTFGGELYVPSHDYHIGGWNEQIGTLYLPGVDGSLDQGYVLASSADGSVLVGLSHGSANAFGQAFRWRAVNGAIQGLGSFDPMTAWVQHSAALGVSSDGSQVVGWALSGGLKTPFRWNPTTGLIDLGRPPGGDAAIATAVSGDGRTIVGHPLSGPARAFVWEVALGMSDLHDRLVELGAFGLNGVSFATARGISADGSRIVGSASDSSGSFRAYIAHLSPIGCYANCDASTTPPILNINDFQCFLNLFATGDSRANCDASTEAPVLNINDFQCFMIRFAQNC